MFPAWWFSIVFCNVDQARYLTSDSRIVIICYHRWWWKWRRTWRTHPKITTNQHVRLVNYNPFPLSLNVPTYFSHLEKCSLLTGLCLFFFGEVILLKFSQTLINKAWTAKSGLCHRPVSRYQQRHDDHRDTLDTKCRSAVDRIERSMSQCTSAGKKNIETSWNHA